MIRRWFAVAICIALSVAYSISVTSAAEIKLLSPLAMRGVMPDVALQFGQSSAHKVAVDYATVGAITDRLVKGEAADVAIVSAPQMEELQKQGKVVAESRSDIARVGVGVFVRSGAPKPDIGAVDSLKRTLLAAKSISYGDPASGGVSGTHMAALVERLGIAAGIKPKTQLLPNSQAVLESVARGDVEIGIGLTSDTALLSGVELVGALPAEVQNFTIYAAGIVATSKQADAARALINFFSSPPIVAALKAKGFEPR
jgi:molybdate transport system substrate-binding protein